MSSDELRELADPEQPEPLPGSLLLAEKIERRKFLRRMSKSFFYGFVAVTSGTTGLLGFLSDPAAAAGACCPSCCGPSPCCASSCCNKPCCSPAGSTNCTNNGSTCLGFSGTWSGNNCWSCTDSISCRTTTCCDCKTNNRTGCPNPNSVNRCICWHIYPFCGADVVDGGPVIRRT